MASKAQKRRQRMARNMAAQAVAMPDAKPDTVKRPPVHIVPKVEAIRPTPERIGKGAFKMPTGPGRKFLPAVDEAHDTIAKLHKAGLINDDQEQAARDWQDLKAAVRAELGVSQGRSCLDISPVGHDNDEGNPALMERWLKVEAELGSLKTGALDFTAVLGHRPANLDLFRVALDLFRGA